MSKEPIDKEALKAAIDFNDHCEIYSDVNEQIRDTILVYLNAAIHQPSGDVVERVARAICESCTADDILPDDPIAPNSDILCWTIYEAEAKAAIAAMQAPAQVDEEELHAKVKRILELTENGDGAEGYTAEGCAWNIINQLKPYLSTKTNTQEGSNHE